MGAPSLGIFALNQNLTATREGLARIGVNAHPRPLQRPLPVVMGGYSPAVHRRAARDAQGWYGFFLDPDAAAEPIESIRLASPMPVATRPSSRSACRRAEGPTPTSSPRTVG
jgi:Luciferase-like monooxygenase